MGWLFGITATVLFITETFRPGEILDREPLINPIGISSFQPFADGPPGYALVFSLIGIFLCKAALEYDAQEAIGVDGALQKLAGQAYGPWLLGLTAAGLLAYALFCLVDARYRDVSANSSG